MAFRININLQTYGTDGASIIEAPSAYFYQDKDNPTEIEESSSVILKFYTDGLFFTIPRRSTNISVSNADKGEYKRISSTEATLSISNPTDDVVVNFLNTQNIQWLEVGPFLPQNTTPIDPRILLSKNQMLNVSDTDQPDIYFAICKDDNKLYIYNKNNDFSEETGKFRVASGSAEVDNVTLANINDILSIKALPYSESAPEADNLDSTLKIIKLPREPLVKHDGYIYIIEEKPYNFYIKEVGNAEAAAEYSCYIYSYDHDSLRYIPHTSVPTDDYLHVENAIKFNLKNNSNYSSSIRIGTTPGGDDICSETGDLTCDQVNTLIAHYIQNNCYITLSTNSGGTIEHE